MKNLAYAIRPLATDMLATLFFAAMFAVTKNLILSTAIGIAIGVGQIAWLLYRRRKIAALQWASVGLVVVMGGAAILTNDPRFIMIKPTVVYIVVAASMLQPGWMMRYMPPAGLPYLPRSLIVGAGYAWAVLMAATALLNLYFAFETSPATWAAFLGIFPMTSKLAAFAIHYSAFSYIGRRNAAAGVTFSNVPDGEVPGAEIPAAA